MHCPRCIRNCCLTVVKLHVEAARKRCRLNNHFCYQETASVNEPFKQWLVASTATAAAHDNRHHHRVCLFNACIHHQLTVCSYLSGFAICRLQYVQQCNTQWIQHTAVTMACHMRSSFLYPSLSCALRLLAYVFVLVALLQKDKQHNKNGKSDFVIYRVGVLRAPLHRHRCVNNAM